MGRDLCYNFYKTERGMAMYCRNCGNSMEETAAYCIRCGGARGTGRAYCPRCGGVTDPGAAFCAGCGCALAGAADPNAKSRVAAGLLGIFLGVFGVHNFYLGYTGKAIAQLLITLMSFGTLGIVSSVWGLIEGILLLSNDASTDASGRPLRS